MSTTILSFEADEGHFQSLIELGRNYYPAGHPALSSDFLKWFYLNNPNGNATLIVAVEDDLWIGVIVLIPIVLVHSGNLRRACFAVNVLTHPAHRSKNLFVKMIRHARTELSKTDTWLLGHPNASATPGWRRQKMQFTAPLRVYLTKIRGVRHWMRETVLASIEEIHDLPLEFWSESDSHLDVHIHYTPEFIAWRYLDAPHLQYRVSALKSKTSLIGLRVTRQFKWPVDLMVDVIGPLSNMKELLSTPFWRPTLVLHSGVGVTGSKLRESSWRLPVEKQFPFFMTTWSGEDLPDTSGITLGASDF